MSDLRPISCHRHAVDDRRSLVVDDGGNGGRAGGGILPRDDFSDAFSLRYHNRLTAPGPMVEDTEKTAVFLYSKVK
jgi:hypothetical protein